MSDPQTLLLRGLDQMGLDMACDGLMQYLSLLHKWNHAYNLTAVRDLNEMVSRHLLDSLAVLPWLHGQSLIDVGTGAGLPGIPLALACPERHVVLLDSLGKKTRFLQEVKRALSLDNVDIIQSRVENYHPKDGFDTVITRAFSHLEQMTTWTHHLIAADGIWLAMKGRYPETELVALQYPYQVETYHVADSEDERCCVIIKRNHHGENHSGC